MFWDGSRWVADPATAASPRPASSRARDRIATLPILVLVPLILVPVLSASAAGAQLTTSGTPVAGAALGVAGSGFSGKTSVQLTWDGSATGMPGVRTSQAGSFDVTITVPATAQPGSHVLGASSSTNGSRRNAANRVSISASLTVMVSDGSPNPSAAALGASPSVADPTPTLSGSSPTATLPWITAGPTLGPTDPPTPGPTAAATLWPTTAPTPTRAPAPTPTATTKPTPGPTPTATPTSAPTPTATPTDPSGQLTFDAECSGSSLPSALKAVYQSGDPGFGLDSDFMGDLRQVSVANGRCTITAERRSTPSGRAYASAAFGTRTTFSQLYGTFEARIRYPKGAGVWPAFWLLEAGSLSTPPEVDVFEAYPGPGTGSSGTSVAVITNHYASSAQYFVYDAGSDLTGSWHTWRLEWTPQAMVVKVDGVQRAKFTSHLPSVPLYPIVNLALGASGYRVDATTPDTLTMDVDYIRVYAP